MADIIHQIAIRAPQTEVAQAFTTTQGLAGWWTEEVEGDPAQGGDLVFRFRNPTGELKGEAQMRVEAATPTGDIRWRCVAGPDEWLDTQITFTLVEAEGKTLLRFGHRAWREATDFTAHCSMKWATFLLSLRQYVETGSGSPAPRDLKIDNWN
jgi:uncharacterized protein YndB with AHSA1/START domain